MDTSEIHSNHLQTVAAAYEEDAEGLYEDISLAFYPFPEQAIVTGFSWRLVCQVRSAVEVNGL